jgi:hypothetical protein
MPSNPKAVIELTAKDKTKAAFQSVTGNMQSLQQRAVALGAALAAATSGGFIANAANSARELELISVRLGASTEELQQFSNVANLASISFEQFSTSLRVQTRRISEAAQGTGEAVNALKELGLVAEDLNNLSPTQQFLELSDALNNVANSADQTRIAIKLWDTEGQKNLQIVKQGTEAIREQANAYSILSDEAIASLGNLKVFFIDIGLQVKSLSNDLINVLAPAVDDFLDRFRSIDTAGLDELRRRLTEVNEQLAIIGKQILTIEKFGGQPGPLYQQYEDLNDIQKELVSTLQEYNKEMSEQDAHVDTWRSQQEEAKNTAVAIKAVTAEVNQLGDEWDKVLDIYIRQEQEVVDEWAKAQAGIVEVTKEANEEIEESVEEIPEIYKQAARNINDAMTGVFRDILDSNEDFITNLRDSLLNGFKDILAQMATLAAKPILINIVSGLGSALGISGGALGALTGSLGGASPVAGLAGLGAFGQTALGLGGVGLAGYLAGGPGGGLGAAAGGLAGLGLAAGTFFPPLWALGAGGLLGGALGSAFGGGLFENTPDEQRVGFSTGGPFDQDISATIKTAFGEVGFVEGANNLKGAALEMLKTVQTFDDAIADFLDSEQIETVSAALQGVGLTLERVTFEAEDMALILEERAVAALEALGLPVDRIREAGDSLEDIGNAVQELLTLNSAIEDFIDSADPRPINQAEQNVENLVSQIDELSTAAADFGFADSVLDDITGAGDDILEQWGGEFADSIEDAILQIEDPLQFSINSLERDFQEWADQLVRTALAFGQDLEAVNKLIDLEADRLDKQIDSLEREASQRASASTTSIATIITDVTLALRDMENPAQDMIDRLEDITGSMQEFLNSIVLSNLSPLSMREQLDIAGQQFRDDLAKANAGDLEAADRIVEAGQSFLEVAKNFFAGTEEYKEIFRFVNESISEFIDTRQGAIDDLNQQFMQQQLDYLERITNSNQLIAYYLRGIRSDLLRQDVAA